MYAWHTFSLVFYQICKDPKWTVPGSCAVAGGKGDEMTSCGAFTALILVARDNLHGENIVLNFHFVPIVALPFFLA